MRLGFVILAHEAAGHLADLIDTLTSDGAVVCLHYDARSSDADFTILKTKYDGRKDVLFAKRERCGWGDFSLVRATLNGLETLRGSGEELDYICLLSGSDLPIKPLRTMKVFLAQQIEQKAEFIESVPLDRAQWVKGGLERERFTYRHYFNERRHPMLFSLCWKTQKRLRRTRPFPKDLRIALGSQWWCLTWATCLGVLDFIKQKPDIYKYFIHTWIPDESFFQTIVRAIVPEERIRNHSLTFYQFSDYGKPYVFFDEHEDFLCRQQFFFGRKVAFSARELRRKLHQLGRSKQLVAVDPERIGNAAQELDAARVLRRSTTKKRRAVGRFYEAKESDIQFTDKLILIHLTAVDLISRTELNLPVQTGQQWLVHGHLYDIERIRFASDKLVFGGYTAHDMAARSGSESRFLANVAGAGPLVTAFTATWVEGMELVLNLSKVSNVLVAVSRGGLLPALIAAQLINRFRIVDPDWRPDPDSVRRCRDEVLQGLGALDVLCEDHLEYPNVRTASASEELIGLAGEKGKAQRLAFGDVLSFVLERNRSAEMQLLTSPLGRYVASVIDRPMEGDVNGKPMEPVSSPAAPVPVQRIASS
jgi:hypothetical protein